jgi:hypothetical protein
MRAQNRIGRGLEKKIVLFAPNGRLHRAPGHQGNSVRHGGRGQGPGPGPGGGAPPAPRLSPVRSLMLDRFQALGENGIHDMINMNKLTEDTILRNIQKRFAKNIIYVR